MGTIRKWVVGLDLTERSHGALRFAAWMRKRSRVDEHLYGVHVMEAFRSEEGDPVGRGRELDRARATTERWAHELPGGDTFEAYEVVPGHAPDQELARIARGHGFYGMIVGRSATISGLSLVSLGRVTRRLLRTVPCPLAIVPPDLDVGAVVYGPILVAVAAEPHALPAVRFGQRLSHDLDLPLVLVHILPERGGFPTFAADSEPAYAPLVEEPSAGEVTEPEALRTWRAEHDLADLPLRLEKGRRSQRLLDVALDLDAGLIVCGSRRLSLGERVFQSSTGTDLAAHARRPVIVVPPTPA